MLDYRICHAQLIDGSGAPAFWGDVGIQNGKIVAVGQLSTATAAHTIDANGAYLTPGFIDIHRHADAALFREGFGRAELAQGLTTVVNGNCGLSLAPVPAQHRAEILAYLEPVTGLPASDLPIDTIQAYLRAADRSPLNIGMLVGGGTVRAAAAGFDPAPLSPEAMDAVHRLLEQSLCEGALGVSLGLGYAPECFYSTQELIDALAPLRHSGIPITVHMRQEGAGVVSALEEMLFVAAQLHTPVHISHLKSIGKAYWRHHMPRMLQLLSRAQVDGLDVSFDLYPYTAGSTQLIHVLPPEAQSGGVECLSQNLLLPEFRKAMRARMQSGTDFENLSLLVGWENIDVSTVTQPENQRYVGKSIATCAELAGCDPFDFVFDLLASEHCATTMIDRITDNEDICDALRSPLCSVISDATYPLSGLLHPRVYGTCAHFLESYVFQRGILPLEQAVMKLTSLPAKVLGLKSKGLLCVGADADLCLFHGESIHETAMYAAPEQYAQGMDFVFVGGVPAIAEGRFLHLANGRILYRENACFSASFPVK